MPIWLIVAVGIIACILQLMRSSGALDLPRAALWVMALFAIIWTTIPVLITLASGDASPGIGWLLGFFCAAAPLIGLIAADAPAEGPSAEHEEAAF